MQDLIFEINLVWVYLEIITLAFIIKLRLDVLKWILNLK